jgi:hypothetical protein
VFSIIGLLRKQLRDYRVWTIEETLEQESVAFTSENAYDGLAVITFNSKKAVEAAIASPEGKNDNESFNEGPPDGLVLAEAPYVFRDAALDVVSPGSVRS